MESKAVTSLPGELGPIYPQPDRPFSPRYSDPAGGHPRSITSLYVSQRGVVTAARAQPKKVSSRKGNHPPRSFTEYEKKLRSVHSAKPAGPAGLGPSVVGELVAQTAGVAVCGFSTAVRSIKLACAGRSEKTRTHKTCGPRYLLISYFYDLFFNPARPGNRARSARKTLSQQ